MRELGLNVRVTVVVGMIRLSNLLRIQGRAYTSDKPMTSKYVETTWKGGFYYISFNLIKNDSSKDSCWCLISNI